MEAVLAEAIQGVTVVVTQAVTVAAILAVTEVAIPVAILAVTEAATPVGTEAATPAAILAVTEVTILAATPVGTAAILAVREATQEVKVEVIQGKAREMEQVGVIHKAHLEFLVNSYFQTLRLLAENPSHLHYLKGNHHLPQQIKMQHRPLRLQALTMKIWTHLLHLSLRQRNLLHHHLLNLPK